MKAGFIAAFGFAATVAAQWGNIASCARTCRDNMVGADKSDELGCDTGDLACLCTKPDFIYGLRDCSRAICDEDQAARILQVGLRVCREAGVEISTGGDQGTGTAGGSNDETVSTVYSTFTSDGSTITSAVDTTTLGGAGGSNDETVSTVYSTFTSDGSTITSAVDTTTLGGAGGGRVVVNTETLSDGSVVLSTTTVEASTTVAATDGEETGASESGSGSASEGSETGSATGSEATSGASATTSDSNATETGTETGNETGTETGSDESGTATDSSGNADETGSTTTSDNAGVPQMTAAPAGVLAAAGLAILLL